MSPPPWFPTATSTSQFSGPGPAFPTSVCTFPFGISLYDSSFRRLHFGFHPQTQLRQSQAPSSFPGSSLPPCNGCISDTSAGKLSPALNPDYHEALKVDQLVSLGKETGH